MPRKGTRKKPKCTLHKQSGQARVRVDGKDHYLGKYGSPERRRRYDDLILEWKQTASGNFPATNFGQLARLYLAYLRKIHQKNGQPTSEVAIAKAALRRMCKVARKEPLHKLRPRHLKQARNPMVKDGLARTTVNRFVGQSGGE